MFNPQWVASANVFLFSGLQVLWITLFPFLAERLGIDLAAVAFAFGIGSLCFLVGAPFWANFSDRHGRVPALLVGIAGLLLSVAWIAILVRAPFGSASVTWVALIASRVVYGLTASAIVPVSQAWQIDSDSDPTRAMQRHSLAQNFGRLVALALAVVTGAAHSIAGATGIVLVVLLALANLAHTNLGSKSPPNLRTSGGSGLGFRAEWRRTFPAIRNSLALALLFTCFLESMSATLAAHLHTELLLSGMGAARQTAELFLLCVLGAVVLQVLGRTFVRRRPNLALGIGAVAMGTGAILLYASNSIGALRGAMIGLAFGIAWIPPVYLARLYRFTAGCTADDTPRTTDVRGARAGMASVAHTLGYGLGGIFAAASLHYGSGTRIVLGTALGLALLLSALRPERSSDGFVAEIAR